MDEQVPVVPAAVVAAAVIAFVAYLSFQGASHAVEFAVTASDVTVRPATEGRDPRSSWPRRARLGQTLVLRVGWTAGEAIGAGSYAVVVSLPSGWRHVGCLPECEWTDGEGVAEFARQLPRPTYPLAAAFEAEESGTVRVAYAATRSGERLSGDFVPTAWLVQTNGDDVLGAEPIPLSS
jgi:hypothetical protein